MERLIFQLLCFVRAIEKKDIFNHVGTVKCLFSYDPSRFQIYIIILNRCGVVLFNFSSLSLSQKGLILLWGIIKIIMLATSKFKYPQNNAYDWWHICIWCAFSMRYWNQPQNTHCKCLVNSFSHQLYSEKSWIRKVSGFMHIMYTIHICFSFWQTINWFINFIRTQSQFYRKNLLNVIWNREIFNINFFMVCLCRTINYSKLCFLFDLWIFFFKFQI